MFAFVFEGVLFEFTYAKPQFAPLYALPPSKRPRGDTTFYLPFFNGESGATSLPVYVLITQRIWPAYAASHI